MGQKRLRATGLEYVKTRKQAKQPLDSFTAKYF